MTDIDLDAIIEAHAETEEPAEPDIERELKLGVMYPITDELVGIFSQIAGMSIDLPALQAVAVLSQEDVDLEALGHTEESRQEVIEDIHYTRVTDALDLVYGHGGYAVAYDLEEEMYWLVVGEGIALETTTDDLDTLTRGETINVVKNLEDFI